MTTWSKEELHAIAGAMELTIAPLREDGAAQGTPIWSVVVGDAIYVRSHRGPSSRWYQAAIGAKAGRITAGGTTTDVTFEPVEGPINDLVDEAYRAKYRGTQHVSDMVAPVPRATTLKVMPARPTR